MEQAGSGLRRSRMGRRLNKRQIAVLMAACGSRPGSCGCAAVPAPSRTELAVRRLSAVNTVTVRSPTCLPPFHGASCWNSSHSTVALVSLADLGSSGMGGDKFLRRRSGVRTPTHGGGCVSSAKRPHVCIEPPVATTRHLRSRDKDHGWESGWYYVLQLSQANFAPPGSLLTPSNVIL
jgi:hypothetical protein